MLRRSFIAGLLLLSGGLAGHHLARGNRTAAHSTPADFFQTTRQLRLNHLSQPLLLKIFSRQVAQEDRHALVKELLDHNRDHFVREAYQRQHGIPGFYRVLE